MADFVCCYTYFLDRSSTDCSQFMRCQSSFLSKSVWLHLQDRAGKTRRSIRRPILTAHASPPPGGVSAATATAGTGAPAAAPPASSRTTTTTTTTKTTTARGRKGRAATTSIQVAFKLRLDCTHPRAFCVSLGTRESAYVPL